MSVTRATELLGDNLAVLSAANAASLERNPGHRPDRQPVHTVYGGAHLFRADTASKMGRVALRHLESYAPDFVEFAHALQLPGHAALPRHANEKAAILTVAADDERFLPGNKPAWLAATVFRRTVEKLQTEPVEDFRIDFEDGFGVRPDAEEDLEAERAAREVALGMQEGTLPPFLGIRIKPFTDELVARSIRTFDLFMGALLSSTDGKLPPNFVVTLPKVTVPEQVATLVRAFKSTEKSFSLSPGALQLEVMIETPRSIFDDHGRVAMPRLLAAAEDRCVAAHFGVYDYTASMEITAANQTMRHPACDFARHVMQVSLAGTGVWISDGATNVMPVAPHNAGPDRSLTADEEQANRHAVHSAWRLGYEDNLHSLRNGYYQGWDLHPAQLPVRYAAVYAFFLDGLDQAASRLRSFIEKAAQATLVGNVFDDAATGQGLLNYFLRATNCGAIADKELERTGLTTDEIRTRSFKQILERRSELERSK